MPVCPSYVLVCLWAYVYGMGCYTSIEENEFDMNRDREEDIDGDIWIDIDGCGAIDRCKMRR